MRYLTAVAAAVALIVAGVWMFSPGADTPTELYTEYMVFEQSPETFGAADALLKKGHLSYDKKDYETALKAYQQALMTPGFESTAEATFYIGLSYMGTKPPKPMNAIEALSATEGYKEMKVEWYIALAWLQANDREAAKKALQKIVAFEKHDFYQEASKLLKELD